MHTRHLERSASKRNELLKIDTIVYQWQTIIAGLCIISIFLSVCVNEVCCAGDYRTSQPDPDYMAFLEDPHRDARSCNAAFAIFLKFASSGVAVALVCSVGVRRRMQHRQTVIKQSLEQDMPATSAAPQGVYIVYWNSICCAIVTRLDARMAMPNTHTLNLNPKP